MSKKTKNEQKAILTNRIHFYTNSFTYIYNPQISKPNLDQQRISIYTSHTPFSFELACEDSK
uniref:Uncharacterized protein n=1 Tax=Schistosoma mansoni TaxID=6183 RepID=A0A5K4F7D7_SCHMA